MFERPFCAWLAESRPNTKQNQKLRLLKIRATLLSYPTPGTRLILNSAIVAEVQYDTVKSENFPVCLLHEILEPTHSTMWRIPIIFLPASSTSFLYINWPTIVHVCAFLPLGGVTTRFCRTQLFSSSTSFSYRLQQEMI